jgi:hypothetical protein
MISDKKGDFDLLSDIKNEYWIKFSKLIAETLKKVPISLHDELLIMLQDASSVYGSNYEKYL